MLPHEKLDELRQPQRAELLKLQQQQLALLAALICKGGPVAAQRNGTAAPTRG